MPAYTGTYIGGTDIDSRTASPQSRRSSTGAASTACPPRASADEAMRVERDSDVPRALLGPEGPRRNRLQSGAAPPQGAERQHTRGRRWAGLEGRSQLVQGVVDLVGGVRRRRQAGERTLRAPRLRVGLCGARALAAWSRGQPGQAQRRGFTASSSRAVGSGVADGRKARGGSHSSAVGQRDGGGGQD